MKKKTQQVKDTDERMTESSKTEVGSYFVSNYPPFSLWSEDQLGEVNCVLDSPPQNVPLGLYLHIPFCRKRCKFCYFKVFTEKNAPEVERYLAALSREIELVSRLPAMGDRQFRFVYFGFVPFRFMLFRLRFVFVVGFLSVVC